MLRRNLLYSLLHSPLAMTALASSVSATRVLAQTLSVNDDTQERVAHIIRTYSEQGIHRTGTGVDTASARWLADELSQLGLTPELESVTLERVVVHEALLRVGNLQWSGVPKYDCAQYSDAHGISGTLGALGGDASIGVVMMPPSPSPAQLQTLHQTRTGGSHRAIVIVTDIAFAAEGPALINAENFHHPVGPPVLQISNRDWPALESAINSGQQATLITHVSHESATAYNVVARLPGRDITAAPFVIMTPRSAWWQSASERGGGIALFLEIARRFAVHGAGRDILLTANTGHELAHIGLDRYLEQRAGLMQQAALWVHLGANFAARGSVVRLQYSSPTLAAVSESFLGARGLHAGITTPPGQRPLGEARNVFDGGGQYLSILGNNPLFHDPTDVWPGAVDLGMTTQWVNAMTDLVVALESEFPQQD